MTKIRAGHGQSYLLTTLVIAMTCFAAWSLLKQPLTDFFEEIAKRLAVIG
jgi:hypothetical protein